MTARRVALSPPAAVLVVMAFVALVLAAVVLADPGGVVLTASYGLAGTVLALRRPREPIAWLLLVTAVGLMFGTTSVRGPVDDLMAGTAGPLASFAAWANGTGWVAVYGGLLGILLLFPQGRLEARWERWLAAALAAAFGAIATILLFGPTVTVTVGGALTMEGTEVPNPYALAPVVALTGADFDTSALWPFLLVFEIVATGAFVWRFLRSRGLERLQFRWLAWAAVWLGIASIGWVLVTGFLRYDYPLVAAAIVLVSYPAIPLAVTVAVLRYRLYEIDRLVSRTLGWGLATAAVVAVFVAGVLALQALLAGVTQSDTLAVAVSTLIAFALFQPIRRAVQSVVDRRFDRPRLEGERVLALHGERLRHVTDLDLIEDGVIDTISRTLRPQSASVWIRGDRAPVP